MLNRFNAVCPRHGMVAFLRSEIQAWYMCERMYCPYVVTDEMLHSNPDGGPEPIHLADLLSQYE